MDLDLDALKRSIAEQLARSEFAVFHHDPGSFDANTVVTWDTETYPDFQMFLEAARHLGIRMIMFAGLEFDESEIAEAEDELEGLSLSRDDHREYEKTLKGFRQHTGATCSIELAFQYETYFYLYEARADWYDEFVGIHDELTSFGGLSSEDEMDEDGGIGGFYSKN